MKRKEMWRLEGKMETKKDGGGVAIPNEAGQRSAVREKGNEVRGDWRKGWRGPGSRSCYQEM